MEYVGLLQLVLHIVPIIFGIKKHKTGKQRKNILISVHHLSRLWFDPENHKLQMHPILPSVNYIHTVCVC